MRWHMHSIQARLVLQVSIGLLVLSSIASGVNYRVTFLREVTTAASLEQQLVRTVQAQAEVAVYAGNVQIADGVIDGLEANPRIRAAHINGLAPPAPHFQAGTGPTDLAATHTDYPLFSPVDGKEQVGVLTVLRNDQRIHAEAAAIALRQTVLLLIQILATATLIVLSSRRVIGKPVAGLARALASIKPGHKDRIRIAAEHAHDEIGSLANSANILIDAAEAALAEVQVKNALIEMNLQLVCETLEQTASLLDNSDEGFLSFSADLKVKTSYSRECEKMLTGPIAGSDIQQLLSPDDPQQRDFIGSALESIFAEKDEYVRNLYFGLLPTEYHLQGRWLAARYRMQGKDSVMAMLTDVTAERELQEKVDREQSRMHFVVEAVRQRDSLIEASAEFRSFLERSGMAGLYLEEGGKETLSELRRHIHTFKGTFAQFFFYHLPQALHRLETGLSQMADPAHGLDLKAVFDQFLPNCQEAFRNDLHAIEEVLGGEFLNQASSYPVTEGDLSRIEQHLASMEESEDRATLDELVKALRFKPLRDMLKAYPAYTRDLAQRLKKELAPFTIEGDGFKVDPQRFAPFCKALIHVFRNAIDHGIELPDDRVDAGKEETGHIACHVRRVGSDIVLTLHDDGRGIDPEQLLAEAARKGIAWTGNPYDLVFEEAFSTRKSITDLSGRGIGLAAVRAEVDRLEGRIEVESSLGSGTTFRFVLPQLSGMAASGPIRRNLIRSVAHWADSYLTDTIGLATVKVSYRMAGLAPFELEQPTAFLVVTASNRQSVVVLSFDRPLIDRLICFHAGQAPADADARASLGGEIATELLNIVMGNATEDLQSWDARVEMTPPVALDAPVQLQSHPAALFFESIITTEAGRLWIRIAEPASQFDQRLSYVNQE